MRGSSARNRHHRLRSVARWVAAAAITAAASAPQPAAAQLSAGSISTLITSANYATSPVKGSDAAWDPVNRVFLVVATCYNTCPYGRAYGVFVNTNSVPVGAPFSIKTSGDGHFPRAAYSPHVNGGQGGFLVVWHEETSGGNLLRTRVIAYSNGTGVKVGVENTINGTSFGWLESAAAVAYSPVSQRFLVAWRVYPSVPGIQITARLVDINGAGVGGLIKLSAGFGRDPGVAWNSLTNEFGVSFGNENGAGSAGFMGFAVVNPSTGTFVRNSFPLIAGFTYVTDLSFNPNTGRYLMTWHQQPGGVPEVWAAEMAADASVVAQGLVTRLWPAYDALSTAFNPVSGTFLLVSLNNPTDNIDGTELNSRGVREGAIVTLGPGVSGKYVRAAAASDDARWAVTFSDGFRWLKSFAVTTTSRLPAPCPIRQPIQDWRTPPPVPTGTWVCVNGEWVAGGFTPTADPTAAPVVTRTTPPNNCNTTKPGSDWVCMNAGWVPGPPGILPTPAPGTCTSVKPGLHWICINGDWLPGTLARTPEPVQELLSTAHVIPAGDDAAYGHGPAAVAELPSHEKRPRANRLSRQ